jgi:sec-independent protein translocase protein TatC
MTETTTARPRRRPAHPDESRMTLVEHLTELRGRLVKSVLALAVATIAAFIFFEPILTFLQRPYCDLPSNLRFPPGGEDCQLYVTGILDQFMIRLRVAMMTGAVASAPVWLWQLWQFVTPGLHPKERRWAVPFIASSILLFGAGAVFAYFTLDNGLQFLLGVGGDRITPILTVDKYLSFVTLMLLAFGVSFEFPLLMMFLNIVGVTPTYKLRKWRRAMFFGLCVFAAVITPSQDPFTFLAMWLPLCGSYEFVILFGRLRDRLRKRRDPESTDQWDDDEVSPL